MSDKKFSLGDYVEVKDRIPLFYEKHPDGRLVTEHVQMTSEPDGTPRVLVKALAYRTPDDPHPGVGWSWMVLPGSTTYTRGSELENTETSAWGRAIGSLGIGIGSGIATGDEVRNKTAEPDVRASIPTGPSTAQDGLVGTAEIGKSRDSDFELRMTPDGPVLGFRLTNGRKGWKVLVRDELALQLLDAKDEVLNQRVTVFGTIREETFRPKNSERDITYPVIHADRVKTAAGTLPIIPAISPGQEPLFSSTEEAAIEAALP